MATAQHPASAGIAGSNLKHTDFEGYRAISGDTIHAIPGDVNGLTEALNPRRYTNPMREQRLIQQENQRPRLDLEMQNNMGRNYAAANFHTPQHQSNKFGNFFDYRRQSQERP